MNSRRAPRHPLALALWLGAFVTYLVRRALPAQALASATTPFRVALEEVRRAVGIRLAQVIAEGSMRPA